MEVIFPDFDKALTAALREDATVIAVSRQEARDLIDDLENAEPLILAMDEAQGDCTDGTPRYIILKISE